MADDPPDPPPDDDAADLAALHEQARLALEAGDAVQAVQLYRRVLALDADNGDAQNDLGRALERAGDTPGAAAAFERAAQLYQAGGSGGEKVALRNQALMLERAGQPAEAEVVLRRALALDADYARAHEDLAGLLHQRGDLAASATHYGNAARLYRAQGADHTAQALQAWGNVLLDLGQVAQAERALRDALALAPSDGDLHNDLGRALDKADNPADAALEFERAAQKFHAAADTDEKVALRNQALMLVRDHRPAEAEPVLRRAIALDTSYARAHEDLADMLRTRGDLDAALAHYTLAAGLYKEQAGDRQALALQGQGKVLLELGRVADAEQALREALALRPDDGDLHNDLGRVLDKAGHDQAAAQAFERAAGRFQADQQAESARIALQNWSLMLSRADDTEGALGPLRQAVALAPEVADAWYLLANALDEAQLPLEAIDAHRKAIHLDPANPYPRHNCAVLLGNIGRYREAWQEWDGTLKAYTDALGGAAAGTERGRSQACYLASVLSGMLARWEEAEACYLGVLRQQPEHLDALTGLADLYARWAESDRPSAAAAARQPALARRAEQAQRRLLGTPAEHGARLVLADLAFDDGDLSAAEDHLAKAAQLSRGHAQRRVDVLSRQGVLATRQDKHDQAVARYTQALRLQPQALGLRVNLAAALVKAKQLDRAEAEFRRVLAVAPGHIDALIGLGQLCIDLAEGGDTDRLAEAERQLMAAIDLGHASRAGSQLLRGRDLAQVQYLLGYTRVKMFEADPGPRATFLLQAAERNFVDSRDNDPATHKATAALGRLRKRLHAARRDELASMAGPVLVCLMCLAVFVYAQVDFHYSATKAASRLGPGNYILVTFSALLFFIAGLFLPRVLKLKVLGIELEKASVDPASPTSGLGIRR